MNSREVRTKVNDFRRTYVEHEPITIDGLKNIAQKLGFTVIQYDSVCSDEDVAVIADSLDLRRILEREKGFTYTDRNYRLVFVNRDLTEEEAVIVFLHELGHIYLGHAERATSFGYDVLEEYAAGEFVHYLLEPSMSGRIAAFVQKKKRLLLCIAAVAVVLILGIVLYSKKKSDEYYSQEFYVTESGKKYHLRKCYYIKGKDVRKLTEDELKSGEYEPCNVCIP